MKRSYAPLPSLSTCLLSAMMIGFVMLLSVSCSSNPVLNDKEQYFALLSLFDQWAMSGNGTLPNIEGSSKRSLDELQSVFDALADERDKLSNRYAYVPGLHIVFNETNESLVLMYSKTPIPANIGEVDLSGNSKGTWRLILLEGQEFEERWVSRIDLNRLLKETLLYIEEKKPPHYQLILDEHRRFLESNIK